MEKEKNKEQSIASYLTFRISEESFAAHVANVVNIQKMTRITEVPNSPDYFMGVINLRGKVLPVIDTRKKLNLALSENTVNTCILVMEITDNNSKAQIGMLVDDVDQVAEIRQDQVQPPPPIGNYLKPDVVSGLYKPEGGEKFIMILDVNKFLASDEPINLKSTTVPVSTTE